MREIKFRAWNVEEGIMCYDNEDDSACYWDGVVASNLALVNSQFRFKGKYEYMQFTGLKDMKGKEICEGDILYCPEYKNRMNNRIVKFEHGQFIGVLNNGYSKPVNQLTWDMEVIGNIYEDLNLFDQN